MTKVSIILTILTFCLTLAVSQYAAAQASKSFVRKPEIHLDPQSTKDVYDGGEGKSNEIDDIGEICDPKKHKSCQSSSSVCQWVREDKLYKCIPLGRKHTHQGYQKRKSDHERSFGVSFNYSAARRQKRSANKRGAGRSVSTAVIVPEYEGLLDWNDDSEQCIEKGDMADELQNEKTTEEDKKNWIETNKHRICNFKNFFHCYLEDFLDQVDILDDPTKQQEVDPGYQPRPACQCYESSMIIVDSKCYIPARFGTKSTCGPKLVAPYPVEPWEGAPVLKPECGPNSDCRESQYYFGKRCECHHTAKFNKTTHACDNATKLTFPMLNIVLLLLPFILCH